MLIDLVKYPVLTEKSNKLLENNNKYTVLVDVRLTKKHIKMLFENLFNVQVIAVNTHRMPRKKKRLGFVEGNKKIYKKAIVTVNPDQFIFNFSFDD
uniref:Large ribosomal subunit protein uL23c n=1 Tax=Acetabularia acetabulum TaxID=35845 RepID=W6MAP3_ACEAT|nr:chloroplast 50S ribosomal protein L23 [Acetabularia acetabulum]